MDVFETRVRGDHAIPPPSSARFVVRDMGDCSPRFMRCSLNNLPTTADMVKTAALPLAVVLQPLAVPQPGDDGVPIVDFGETGPVRCSRCKAYINPFNKWVEGGNKFQCALCGGTTPCPPSYFCHMGPDGRRRDADERAELCRGSIEVVATSEYMVGVGGGVCCMGVGGDGVL